MAVGLRLLRRQQPQAATQDAAPMKVQRIKALELGTDPVNRGERLRAYYTNQGEPYREGCQIALEIPFEGWPRETASIFLETHEAAALRDWLDKFIPKQ